MNRSRLILPRTARSLVASQVRRMPFKYWDLVSKSSAYLIAKKILTKFSAQALVTTLLRPAHKLSKPIKRLRFSNSIAIRIRVISAANSSFPAGCFFSCMYRSITLPGTKVGSGITQESPRFSKKFICCETIWLDLMVLEISNTIFKQVMNLKM